MRNSKNPECFLDAPWRPHSSMWNPTTAGFYGDYITLCGSEGTSNTNANNRTDKQMWWKNQRINLLMGTLVYVLQNVVPLMHTDVGRD